MPAITTPSKNRRSLEEGRRRNVRLCFGFQGQNRWQRDSQKTPRSLDGGETGADDSDSDDNSRHPDSRAESRHQEVGRTVEENVGDIEESQGCRCLLCRQVQDLLKRMACCLVHRLGETDIGSNGRAEEIQEPECCGRENTVVSNGKSNRTHQRLEPHTRNNPTVNFPGDGTLAKLQSGKSIAPTHL